MKRSLSEFGQTLRKAARVIPLAALVLGVSALGDPAHVTSGGAYESQIADILLSGKHAAGASNYNEQLLQRLYAQGMTAAPDVLAIGSSRLMPLRARDFAPRTFYNASVSSATLRDILAVDQLFTQGAKHPSLLILGIDPWAFQANDKMIGWQRLAPEFERACQNAGLTPCDDAPWFGEEKRALAALLSPSYFQASAAALWRRATGLESGRRTVHAVDDDNASPAEPVRRADGSLRYPASFGSDLEEVRASARSFGHDFERGRVPFMLPSAELNPRFLHILERFIGMKRAAGVEVWIVLSPYHPDAWPALSAPGSMVTRAEDATRSMALALRVPVLGSFDPRAAGCSDPAEYDDPTHPRESCLARITSPSTAIVDADPSHQRRPSS